MLFDRWKKISQAPREKGWYIVEKIADDGDGLIDDWTDTHYWNGKAWDSPTICFNRWYSHRYEWKVDAAASVQNIGSS